MSWTDDRISLLKRMWKEGKSAADIAKALAKGVTRNAVIGKAHRMGLSGRPSPIKKPAPAKKEAVKKAAPAPAKKAAPATPAVTGIKNNPLVKEQQSLERKATPIRELAPPPGGGVALIDLTERMCKWPFGDPREDDFTFCGRAIRPGTPYCPDHAGLAYQSSGRKSAVIAEKEVVEDVVEDEEEEDDEEVVTEA